MKMQMELNQILKKYSKNFQTSEPYYKKIQAIEFSDYSLIIREIESAYKRKADGLIKKENTNEPVQVEDGEWHYYGCYIQKQDHPQLLPFHVFQDTEDQDTVGTAHTFEEAKAIARANRVISPVSKY